MQEAFWSGEAKYVEELANKHYKIIMAHIKDALKDGRFWEGKQYFIENFGVYDLNQATLKTKPFKERDLRALFYYQEMTLKMLKPAIKRFLDLVEAEGKQKRIEKLTNKGEDILERAQANLRLAEAINERYQEHIGEHNANEENAPQEP